MRNADPLHRSRYRPLAAVALVVVSLGLAGCGGGARTRPASAGAAAPVNPDWAIDNLKEAIALLNEGQPDKARAKLVKVLRVQPGDTMAANLLKQIDTDPKLLLGAENYSYTVKEGETMSVLAQRFLGDPLKSYALARYNGLGSPLQVQPGQKLLIPGKRQLAAPAPAKKAPAAAPAKKSATATRAPAAQPKAPAPAANPTLAARLRGQGLAALNGGSINRAVVLLRQALANDPASAVIKGDLARALRIQSTLAARP